MAIEILFTNLAKKAPIFCSINISWILWIVLLKKTTWLRLKPRISKTCKAIRKKQWHLKMIGMNYFETMAVRNRM